MFRKIEILIMIIITIFVISGIIFFQIEKNNIDYYDRAEKMCKNAFYYNYFGCMEKKGFYLIN